MTMAFVSRSSLAVSLIALAIVAGCGTSFRRAPPHARTAVAARAVGPTRGAIRSYPCGSDTCMTGQTFCYIPSLEARQDPEHRVRA